MSCLDDGKRKTKRGWSPGDSLNLVRVLSVRVNYSQQCRNDINGRWEYSKSIMMHFISFKKMLLKMSTKWWPFRPGLNVFLVLCVQFVSCGCNSRLDERLHLAG